MADTPPYRIGPTYRERVPGPGGVPLVLRAIRPDDAPRLAAGLSQLSPESRYRRFFTAKDALTEAELRYLTNVDGVDHVALALARIAEDGSEADGVGIGRFVRLAEPNVAEPALAIVDAMQGHGLGRLLLRRLIAAATERGIDTFQCEFLTINDGMRELLADAADDIHFVRDGDVVTATMQLPPATDARQELPRQSGDEAEHPPELGARVPKAARRWLGLAAAQWLQLRHRIEAAINGR